MMNLEIAPLETEIKANWEEAKMYCFSLGEGWRLPTIEEFEWIAEFDNLSKFSQSAYWTSNKYSESQAVVKYMVGNRLRFVRPKSDLVRVRPVRDLDI